MESLLVSVLVVVLVAGVCIWAIGLLPLPHPYGLIARVLIALMVVLYLVRVVMPLGRI